MHQRRRRRGAVLHRVQRDHGRRVHSAVVEVDRGVGRHVAGRGDAAVEEVPLRLAPARRRVPVGGGEAGAGLRALERLRAQRGCAVPEGNACGATGVRARVELRWSPDRGIAAPRLRLGRAPRPTACPRRKSRTGGPVGGHVGVGGAVGEAALRDVAARAGLMEQLVAHTRHGGAFMVHPRRLVGGHCGGGGGGASSGAQKDAVGSTRGRAPARAHAPPPRRAATHESPRPPWRSGPGGEKRWR